MNTYDDRLFKGGIRKYIHELRFKWMSSKLADLNRIYGRGEGLSIIEIGCFNSRSLAYLDFEPTCYFGLDAGWEGGLEEAKNKFPQHTFLQSTSHDDITGSWDVSLALETLEHLPRPKDLDLYLKSLSKHSKILVATVPVEIGFIFALKYLYKLLVHRYDHRHSFSEFFYQTLGRCDLVTQDNHRGFDYRELLKLIDQYFTIELCEGLNKRIPIFFNTQIGIIAKSKIST